MCESVCRVCLVGNVKMYNIESNRVVAIYENVTGTKLDSAPGPRVICYICYSLLRRCSRFSELAHKSENILKGLTNKGIEATHTNILKLNMEFKCSISKNVTQFLVLNASQYSNPPSPLVTVKEEPIAVELKEEYTENYPIVIEWKKESSDEDSPSIDDSPGTEDPLTISLQTTKSEDVSVYFCEDSSSIKHDFEKPCYVNPKKLSQKSTLSNMGTTGEKKYACNICHKQFSIKYSLTQHLQTHTGIKPYVCDLCPKKFLLSVSLKRHIRTHTKEKPFTCNLCQKQFTVKHHLTRHMSTHTGEKPYVCDTCHKKFSEKNHLMRHIQTHTGARQYACELCPKKFSVNDSLKRHMRTHTKDMKYACDKCHKYFSQKICLNTHMRTHTGEKPYSCSLCHKQFSAKMYLTKHIRTHTTEKSHFCDTCHEQFSLKDSLKRHMRTHTGEKPYTCDICHKQFSHKNTLLYHIEAKHTGKKKKCTNKKHTNNIAAIEINIL